MLLELLQSDAGLLVVLINTENLDAVAATRDVQSPIPRTPYERRLRVERVVPTTNHQLRPALGIKRKVDMPSPPGEFVLFGEIVWRNLVPEEAPIRTHFDAFRPPTPSAICPAFDFDQPVVNDHLFGPWFHDRTAHWHLLDLYAAGGELIVLPDLTVKIEILSRLDWRGGGMSQGLYTVQPLDGTSTDVA